MDVNRDKIAKSNILIFLFKVYPKTLRKANNNLLEF
jgi:hypothetical protein